MNIYVKEFIKRGFLFSGLGPVTASIVIFIVSLFEENLQLDGLQVLIMAVTASSMGEMGVLPSFRQELRFSIR